MADIDGLWYYMRERERIRLMRENKVPWPWTSDPILMKYKFTNVRRLHDRTTQHFYHNFYKNHRFSPEAEALYNCGNLRYHGTVNWAERCGWQAEHDTSFLVSLARQMIDSGEQVYTGAYIVTNGGRHGFKEEVVASFLQDLWEAAPKIVNAIEESLTWQAGYKILKKVDGFGGSGFMAKEVLQDYIIWWKARNKALFRSLTLTDELSWSPVGPGARRGLNRLSNRPLGFQQSERKFVEELLGVYDQILWRWMDQFQLDNNLSAHDVQFCICEYDKYERVRLGEGRPRSLYHPPEV